MPMQIKVADFGDDSIVYNITGCTREALENKLALFFTSENLVLKSDTPDEKVYGRGNKILRVLLGVFVKYFKLTVSVHQQNDIFSVRLFRDMNFIMSGGLIGIKSSRKEFTRITDAFKIYFTD